MKTENGAVHCPAEGRLFLGRVRGRIQYYVSCTAAGLLKDQRWNAGEVIITSREHDGENNDLLLDTRANLQR
jgi:hypothetical protein